MVKNWFKRKKNRNDENKKLPVLNNWATYIDFVFFPNDDEMKRHLITDVKNSKAERILVVGGVNLFEGDNPAIFGDRELLINNTMSLNKLCKMCQKIRNSDHKSVLVTNFPRKTDPPTVRYVEFPGGIAKADGQLPGKVMEVSAPPGTSLSVCSNSQTKLAIYFVNISASSYYKSVFSAQNCESKTLVKCKVLSSQNNNGLLYNERRRLALTKDPSEQRVMLIKASEDLETQSLINESYRETTQYSGGILWS
jgi:hypothetical protein